MQLAERIGLHFTFVSSVERGERNLSLASLLRLAEGLETDPATLVKGLRWSEEAD
jgi:transcriptional regulator with XRE-family HTH domain